MFRNPVRIAVALLIAFALGFAFLYLRGACARKSAKRRPPAGVQRLVARKHDVFYNDCLILRGCDRRGAGEPAAPERPPT